MALQKPFTPDWETVPYQRAYWRVVEVTFNKAQGYASCIVLIYKDRQTRWDGAAPMAQRVYHFTDDTFLHFFALPVQEQEEWNIIKACYLALKASEEFENAKDV